MKIIHLLALALGTGLIACGQKKEATTPGTTVSTASQTIALPAPYATKSAVHFSRVIGWPAGKTPQAPAGFVVTEFARDLNSPRWLYVGPNGDVFVAESNTEPKGIKDNVIAVVTGQNKSQPSGQSANRITILRDTNHDGKPDQREAFLTGLNQPFGMLILGDKFYVANTDGLLAFPYQTGQTSLISTRGASTPGASTRGKLILALPAGGYNNHWTRNLLARPDGQKIYISVGSGSNVGENGMENEVRRATILEINPDGTGERIYASGLRNPVGMAWQPNTNQSAKPTLYTTVNERDGLGDELVPDYVTSVQEGAFYGWPYSYYGHNEDPRRRGERPDLVKKAVVPDVALGAHTASLGLAFYDIAGLRSAGLRSAGLRSSFPEKYHNGAFIGQHGSWNRAEFSGYKVVFVPFKGGKPDKPEDFLTGFVAGTGKDVYGRPVGVAVLPDGSLLVADDAAGRIWRVSKQTE